MRTSPFTHQVPYYHYENDLQTYKRALPPDYYDSLEKEEIESMEETDTEKNFKKVNIGIHKKSDRHLIRDSNKFREETETKPDINETMQKYRKQYELEKLKYCEERYKYFY